MKKAISIFLTVLLLFGTASLGLTATAEDPPAVIAEGTCGRNTTWTLDSAGTLTVSGTGGTDDYVYYNGIDYRLEDDMPWLGLRDSIQKVVVNDGVTSLGHGAFYECKHLKEVVLADSVTYLGYATFYHCTALESVALSSGCQFRACNAQHRNSWRRKSLH